VVKCQARRKKRLNGKKVTTKKKIVPEESGNIKKRGCKENSGNKEENSGNKAETDGLKEKSGNKEE
jgi:hypothetical protein